MKTGAKLRGGCEEDYVGRHIERQMGCMTGFFQIFDRHQIYAAKRLASFPSPAASCSSTSERSDSSISSSCKDFPVRILPHLADVPPRPSLPLPVFEVKEGRSSWKFKEAPRLSLDSRVDARSKNPDLKRSPSVVAKLMGLDALPCEARTRDLSPKVDLQKKTELRRSVSESRVTRDAVQYQFVDTRYIPSPSPQADFIFENKLREVRRCIIQEGRTESRGGHLSSSCRQRSQPPSNEFSVLQRKSFFDARDYFLPEPPKKPPENVESFKQVLEVFQLKGLLHSRHERHHYPNIRNSYESLPMKSSPRSTPQRFHSPPIEETPRKTNRGKNTKSCQRIPTPVPPTRKQLNPPQSPRSKHTKPDPSTPKSRIPFDSQVDGRMLLERCDKILSSIAEITSEAEQPQQPSPVSVLEFDSPPVDDDVAYIADILPRGDSYRKSLPPDERLLFDAVKEIAEGRREVPPWDSFRSSRRIRKMETKLRPEEVWAELQRMQERAPARDGGGDICELICGVLRKDLEGRFSSSAEISDVVLDIERLVYKDLVADAIRDLAECSERRGRKLGRALAAPLRRRLMF